MSFASLLQNIPRGRINIPGGQTEGFVKPTEDLDEPYEPIVPAERRGDQYAEKYILEEEEEEYRLLEGNQAGSMNEKTGTLCDVDELTSIGTMPNLAQLKLDEGDNSLFQEYRLKPGEFKDLPVFQYQTKLMGLINTNSVVVIKGKTGCGKSTQVPLMILDDYAQRKQFCNIVVTQPRRIAAMSVTNTVCKIYNMKLGSLIGYQIGLDRKTSPQTRLTYCTNGVLLQKLVRAKSMEEYSHIILDEVHERTQEMDFLMLLVRKLQRTNSRNVKIILMSATIDVDPYAKYFSKIVGNVREAAPVINIEKECTHRVQIFYTDELEDKLGTFPETDKGDHKIHPDAYNWVIKLIKAFDYIDKMEDRGKGSVLVFLPGILEIESMFEALNREKDEFLWWICPLHSTITADEQMKVFQPPPKNKRKVILSTNIAESSITVNDIRYVIDFCLTKSMRLDDETNLSSLRLCSASQSMCEQRAGRAGRVMDGRVYRLVRKFFYNSLPYENSPEMLNSSLEITVLKAKQLDMGEPKKILALAMDPPDLTNLKKTILKLKEIGAMFLKTEEKYNEDDGELTVMGNVMASLPLDIQMTKLILLGHCFNLLNDAIIMACSMSVKSMFSRPFKKDVDAYISKLTWADSLCSDPIACVNAYNTWRINKTSGKFNLSAGQAESQWAQRYFIQLHAMREVAKLAEEVTIRLTEFNVMETRPPKTEEWAMLKQILLKVILAGACYPNFYMRGDLAGQINEREAVKLLGSRDPSNTVYLTNFPLDQPGPLYSSAIKKLFVQCGVPSSNIKISFDGSSRVYVEFKSDSTPSEYDGADGRKLCSTIQGKISMAVYRAVKLRHGKVPLEIPLLPVEEANKRVNQARKNYLEQKKSTKETMQLILPSIDKEHIEMRVTHINDITNFYAHQKNSYTHERIGAYHSILNQQGQLKKALHIEENEFYAAPYFREEEGYLYRCKVLSINKPFVEVMFIDYGNIERLDTTFIFVLPKKGHFPSQDHEPIPIDLKNEPPLAFNCRLAHVLPTPSISRGRAPNRTSELFSDLCLMKDSVGKVYSVVENVVALDILIPEENSSSYQSQEPEYLNVNDLLVNRKLAKVTEEGYLSKINHDWRVNHQSKFNSYNSAADDQEEESEASTETLYDNDYALEMKSPSRNETHLSMHLKGPFSPLEMKIHGCLRSSINKTIAVEMDSINSVLLDDSPEDPHERMLVAGDVVRSSYSDRLNLRHTTMLPIIHGLPAFLCLLFSPYVELRVDQKVSRLTGAICGLGYDPVTKKSYFPEHDFEITFDTVFSMKQIELINKLRSLLSTCIAPYKECAYYNTEITRHQATVYRLIQESFRLLANQPPERIQTCKSYKWGQIDEMYLMYPGTPGTMKFPIIYQLIYGVDINSRKVDMEQMCVDFQKNIEDIKKIRDGLKIFKPTQCELCQVSLDSMQSLRLHFMSSQHILLCKRFKLNN